MTFAQLTEKERTYAIMAIIFGLLAFIAIIVSGVSLSRPGTPTVTISEMSGHATVGGTNSQVGHAGVPGTNTGATVYSIAVGHDHGAHEYIDDQGYIKGLGPDLIHAVCEASHLHCRLVWDKYENCWFSEVGRHSSGGKGLMGKWYDACAGWATTSDRIQVFDFSSPYLQTEKTHFYYKKGNSFSESDLATKKIGFLNGWASDEKCLNRKTNVNLSPENVIYVNEKADLLRMMNNGQIDAAFVTESTFELDSAQVNKVGEYDCMIGGTAIMARKDSPFLTYWNNGFAMIVKNGKFKRMCQKALKTHGEKGSIHCSGIVEPNPAANNTQ